MGKSTAALAFVCALVLAVPGSAAAQQAGGGNGIKVGEGRIHPFFDLELRLDSAAAFYTTGPGSRPQLGAEFIPHFRPGLRMEVPGSNVRFGLNGFADFVWYTGLITPGSSFATHLGGQADINAAFNEQGAVEFRIGDHFVRSDRSQNPAVGLGVISLFNEVRAEVPIHPGGRALEVTPGASFTIEYFDPLTTGIIPGCQPGDPLCTPTAVSALNYNNVGFHLDGRYKFLPKTAIVLDADFNMRNYPSSPTPPAMLLSATAGLAGLVSPKISLVAKAGWSQDFAGVNAKTVTGHVELSYLASQTASFKVGYLRALEPIAVLTTFGDDRGYVEGRALFGGKLTVRGYAGFDYLTFYGAPRHDIAVTVDAGPEYQFTPWFTGAAGYVLSVRTSDASTSETSNYVRHEGYVRLSVSY